MSILANFWIAVKQKISSKKNMERLEKTFVKSRKTILSQPLICNLLTFTARPGKGSLEIERSLLPKNRMILFSDQGHLVFLQKMRSVPDRGQGMP